MSLAFVYIRMVGIYNKTINNYLFNKIYSHLLKIYSFYISSKGTQIFHFTIYIFNIDNTNLAAAKYVIICVLDFYNTLHKIQILLNDMTDV